jgi:hypothetical protein
MIDFILAHKAEISFAVLFVLSELAALNPKIAANGIFHGIYIFVKKFVSANPLPNQPQ